MAAITLVGPDVTMRTSYLNFVIHATTINTVDTKLGVGPGSLAVYTALSNVSPLSLICISLVWHTGVKTTHV